MFSNRQRELVRYIWQEGSISRSEISRLAQIRPNTVGTLIADLMELGVLRECEAVPSQGGRPRLRHADLRQRGDRGQLLVWRRLL